MKKRSLVFLLVSVMCLMFCHPVAMAIMREDDDVVVEDSDMKVVTVNKKRAFNLSPKSFSDAYNSLVDSMEVSDEEAWYLLRNDVHLVDDGSGVRSTKFSLDGGSIYFISTGSSVSKSKIREIQVELMDWDEDASIKMALTLFVVHVYDVDTVEDVSVRLDKAMESGKSQTSFSVGKIKYTIKNSENKSVVHITPR